MEQIPSKQRVNGSKYINADRHRGRFNIIYVRCRFAERVAPNVGRCLIKVSREIASLLCHHFRVIATEFEHWPTILHSFPQPATLFH